MSTPYDCPHTVFHSIPGDTLRRVEESDAPPHPGLYLIDRQGDLFLCMEVDAAGPPQWRVLDSVGRRREVISGVGVFVPPERLDAAATELADGAVLAVVDGGTPSTPPTTQPEAYVCTTNGDGGYTCWKR